MAEKKKYNSILVSGRKDETLTYSKFVKDEESGESVKESLDKKVNVTDELTTQQIKDGAITNEKMAADSVGNTNLQDVSVSNEKLEDGSITNEKLAENSITKDKLKDNTIGIEKLDPELRQTINAATGLPKDLVETIQNVDDTLKDHQRQLDDKQSQIDDKQQQITANDEDISLLQTRSTQMEETIKSIAASGGASQATAVTYDNKKSKLTAVNIQSAVDEVVDKTAIKDEEDNVQDTPFRVIENAEFIMAVVDSEDKVLFGIYRATGKPYYPQNDMYHISQSEEFLWVILDAANHPLLGIQQDGTCWAAKAQWLDDIKAIKEALSSIVATFKNYQPKEDGKGLINLDVADSFFYISNDEYIIAVVDIENRILAGIKYDGEPYFPNHEMYSVITNEEWLYAIIDAEEKVLGGFRAIDGHMIVGGIDISTFIANAIIDMSDIKERTAHLSTIENDEYLSVETDAEGKVIGYIAPDGSHYLYKVKSETIPTEFEHIEDPEGRMEITTDADDRVLAYRDSEGKKHEHSMETKNLEVSNLNLQGNSVNNIQEALKANGFNVKAPIDWSENREIQIPEPRLAFVNITNIDSMPTRKGQDMHAIFEFWDMQGNYFKKRAILNAQGNASMYMPKKNFACDFCNDQWIGDDTFKIKFGSWVFQDSFHFKAYYADFFKGVSMVGYKLFNEIESTRDFSLNRVWKRALLPSNDTIGYSTIGLKDIKDSNILFGSGARCYPDGFPCVVYLNGAFYGVFSWALKKHRDNYMLNKSKPEHIHLDGEIYDTFLYNGKIDWDVVNGVKPSSSAINDGFEFRNPKSLICMDGTKYDADNNRKELIDTTSPFYDENNKNHVLTSKVKAYYITLTTYIPQLQAMENGNREEALIKEKIKTFFDITSLIDYLIFSDIVYNPDGTRKNWQWLTYNGIKWAVCPYDLDAIFGWSGWEEKSPNLGRVGDDLKIPTGWIIKYFENELVERYKELRMNVLTTENIFGLLIDWVNRIGSSNLGKDLKKWPLTPEMYPSYYMEHFDNIYRVNNWLKARFKKCDEIYKYNQ